MDRAASGMYGISVAPEYGLFPRGMIAIYNTLKLMRAANPMKTYAMSAAAVELSIAGNEDMFHKSGNGDQVNMGDVQKYGSMVNGIALDKAQKPPALFGHTERLLETDADLLSVFRALASRNTAGTQMNDSSSRSHCFAFLYLHVHDKATDTITKTRFQFCDLAGSERMKEAHGFSNWKDGGMEALTGLATNYSLMMLAQCINDLVDKRKAGKKTCDHTFRQYKVDLIPLLGESLSGSALTALFVCISQSPQNNSQSFHALNFGDMFSKLYIKRKRVKPRSRAEVIKEHKSRMAGNCKALGTTRSFSHVYGGSKYQVLRLAQNRESDFLIRLYEKMGE